MKMAKKAIDYNYSPNAVLYTYSNFAYEEFKSLGKGDSVFFNIVIEYGKWKAKNICVTYAKDIKNN